jgi:hypothetical protein
MFTEPLFTEKALPVLDLERYERGPLERAAFLAELRAATRDIVSSCRFNSRRIVLAHGGAATSGSRRPLSGGTCKHAWARWATA